ncbi:transcriptional repressor [Chryseobacterium sp. MYb264]|uniref:Fur family transcriptional regulator n=1 Tax=Chryseobacterium sp. MYb264 TaxID=2745153 RepID=UPI002E0EFA50|nr:transcriptional repressor [Chryseobacterium sp. MYb264]
MKQTRNTQAKTEILNLINDSETALSHHNIQEKLSNLCNRVTIYRVLDRLEEEGKIHKIVNIDGVVNYAKCHDCEKDHHNHNHLHFNCKKCNSVTCIENVVPKIDIPKEFIVEDYNFIVSGICPKCQ